MINISPFLNSRLCPKMCISRKDKEMWKIFCKKSGKKWQVVAKFYTFDQEIEFLASVIAS